MIDIHSIFRFFLLITMTLSLYILISGLLTGDKIKKSLISAWQFPMLLAIFIETFIFEGL